MLRLSSTYVVVRDMERSVEFYSLLLGMEPSARVLDRWAQFDLDGGCFGIFNQMFDYKVFTSGNTTDAMFNKAYIERLSRHNTVFGNNVIHHFRVDDLGIEYDRLLSLNIGLLSDILYVNVTFPYFFFTLNDPDGNIIEITGNYSAVTDDADDADVSAAESSDAGAATALRLEKHPIEASVEPVKLQRTKKSIKPEEEPPVKKSILPEEELPVKKSIQPEEELPIKKSILPEEELPIKKSILPEEELPFKKFIKPEDESPVIQSIEPENEPVDLLDESVVVQPDKDVSIDEIRFAIKDESSAMREETFINHSILRAAILKERERQIREQANGIPIFKPIEPEPEPEPEEPIMEPIEQESELPKSEPPKRSNREKSERNRPIWDEPAKDLWRDE